MENFDLRKYLAENRLLEEEGAAELEATLKSFASQLKSQADSAKPSPKDGEVNEIGITTILSLIVGAPGLMSFLGKAADGIADVLDKGLDSEVFKDDTYQKDGSENIPKSTVVGKWLREKGHKLEEVYVDSLGGWLKTAYPKKYEGQDVHDKKSKLYDDAHKIYAGMLIAGAVGAGVDAVNATNAVVGGLEGGAATLKTKEVVDIASKIAAA
jgi:hypothetical protein